MKHSYFSNDFIIAINFSVVETVCCHNFCSCYIHVKKFESNTLYMYLFIEIS